MDRISKCELSDPKLETLYFLSWFYIFGNRRKIHLWWCYLPSFAFNKEMEGMDSNTFHKAAKVLLILYFSGFLSFQTLSRKQHKRMPFPFFCVAITYFGLASTTTQLQGGGLTGEAMMEWTDLIIEPLRKDARIWISTEMVNSMNLTFIQGYLRESNSVRWAQQLIEAMILSFSSTLGLPGELSQLLITQVVLINLPVVGAEISVWF